VPISFVISINRQNLRLLLWEKTRRLKAGDLKIGNKQ
jgi:hypothetical protein